MVPSVHDLFSCSVQNVNKVKNKHTSLGNEENKQALTLIDLYSIYADHFSNGGVGIIFSPL